MLPFCADQLKDYFINQIACPDKQVPYIDFQRSYRRQKKAKADSQVFVVGGYDLPIKVPGTGFQHEIIPYNTNFPLNNEAPILNDCVNELSEILGKIIFIPFSRISSYSFIILSRA
ncbi:hypothetical protein AYI68_g1793 [Smittium mucronatum]|uniref:Uncharacterized protein n=1 Tax=Smittium mucronatum TaxID=133383 RepID=A0A1R0H4S1_9FUNG|nr:hypothetical protein AYI68_g1793 [Smittium mucronatum]